MATCSCLHRPFSAWQNDLPAHYEEMLYVFTSMISIHACLWGDWEGDEMPWSRKWALFPPSSLRYLVGENYKNMRLQSSPDICPKSRGMVTSRQEINSIFYKFLIPIPRKPNPASHLCYWGLISDPRIQRCQRAAGVEHSELKPSFI